MYFWSKKYVKEQFLSYVSQQKVIQGLAKGERLGDVSKFKTSSHQRDRGEEAREIQGSLVFGFNWKTKRVRWLMKGGKKKMEKVHDFLHRSTKLNASLTLFIELDKNYYRVVHLQERNSELIKIKRGRRTDKVELKPLKVEDSSILHHQIVKDVDYPKKVEQKFNVEEH
ncbi:hypothetical protein KY284_000828 [Solanum tuberosum]|nr:hypothetical protein KY284_000828 [Solanum tuberosum]